MPKASKANPKTFQVTLLGRKFPTFTKTKAYIRKL
jgi:hypothetical protein